MFIKMNVLTNLSDSELSIDMAFQNCRKSRAKNSVS